MTEDDSQQQTANSQWQISPFSNFQISTFSNFQINPLNWQTTFY
jgi:hypothetical protein